MDLKSELTDVLERHMDVPQAPNDEVQFLRQDIYFLAGIIVGLTHSATPKD